MGRQFAAVAAAIALFVVAIVAASPNASAEADLRAAPVAPVIVHTLSTTNTAALPAVTFDPVKATNAYLARVSGAARERSDSYFEGGYVLIFVDAIYAIAVSALLLWTGISASMRDMAQKVTRSRFWQVPIYVAMFVVVTTVLTFPLTVYENFFREHA
jgi:STE24 endopeptidase